MTHPEKAKELFTRGYNCAQSVFAAFCDLTGMDEKEALRLSSSFGGGFGRLREVCGAVSGMALVLGALYGYDDPTDKEIKKAHYARVQTVCGAFRDRHGTLICRELLADVKHTPGNTPEPRTEAFYHERPCAGLVESAAEILDGFLASHPID